MCSGSHEVSDRLPRVVLLDESLTDAHRVSAGGGVGQQVMRSANTTLRDLDDRDRKQGRDPPERLTIDVQRTQVPCVDADDALTGIDCATCLVSVVNFDKSGHA